MENWSDWPSILKVTFFLGIWLILWLPLAVPFAFAVKWKPFKPFTVQQKLPLVLMLYGLAPLLIVGICHLEHTTLSDYGLFWRTSFFVSALWGLGLGGFSLIGVFVLEGGMGWVQWHLEQMPQLLKCLFPLLVIALWVGITEEAIFRGLFITQLENRYSPLLAAAISSAIFALLHLIWERKETIPQLPGLWLMGIVLALARGFDGGSIGLAWGLHAGWIWGLATLEAAQLISYPSARPIWLTGFYQHPLAGMAGILYLLLVGSILGLLKG